MIKVIPDLSKSEINDKYIKSKKINGFSNGEISFEDGTINEEDNIELSNDKEISSIKSVRNISLIGNDKNVLNNIEIEENGLLDLNETNNENIIEGIIKGLTINYNSETELVYNETDENISNKIKKIISNIKLTNLNESRYVNEKDNYKVEIPKIKNYKDLRKLVVAFKQPIQFSSTLFKTNKLGLKMALNAQVSFFPGNGTSIIKMILIMNEKKINLIDKKIITNFRNIADEILNLINKIAAGIYDINYEFESYLESIENEIKRNISLLEDNLNKTYNISEIYDDDVKEISEKLIKNIYEERYEYLIENYKNNNDELNELKNRTNFTNIITESNSNFQIFYNESLDKINKVYEDIKKFFYDINRRIENEYNIELEIDAYYGIDDELKIINQRYLEFISKLNDSIENEIYEFNNRINKEFKNIIESNLTEIEKIVEEMKYNERVKSMFNSWNKNSDKEAMISNFEKYRNIIYDIFNSMKNSIYDNYMNILKENEINQNLTSQLNEIIQNQTELFQKLEVFLNNLNLNFTIYVEDMKCFFNVEREISEKIKEGYIKYFLKPLSQLEDNYLTQEIINNITSEFSIRLNNIKLLIQNKTGSNGIYNSYTNLIVDYVNQVVNTYLSEEMISKTIERFNYSELLREQTENFYNSLNASNRKYEEVCYENYFKKHLESYISKPEEILNKLEQLNEIEKLRKNYTLGNITEIIINEIKYSIHESYTKIFKILENEYDKMFIDYPRSEYENSLKEGELNFITTFNNWLKSLKNDKGQMGIKNITIISKQLDPFKLQSLFNNETLFYYNFTYLTNKIKHDYNFRFCEGELHDYCPRSIKSTLPDEIDQYNYQIAKVRSAISEMKTLVTLSTNFISKEKTLSNLNSSNYYEEYKNLNNFKGDSIIADIISYLNEINSGDDNLIKPYFDRIKNEISTKFNENINIEKIRNMIILNITKNVFIFSDTLNANLRTMKSNIKSSIMRAFSNEQNYYKNKKYTSPP